MLTVGDIQKAQGERFSETRQTEKQAGGFRLLDTQFVTSHLQTFGAIEVPQRQYHKLLEASLVGEADFSAFSSAPVMSGADAVDWAQR